MSEREFKQLISDKLTELIEEFESTLCKAESEILQKKIEACNVLLDLPVIKNKLQWN